MIKFNGILGDSGHRGPWSSYKPCNHTNHVIMTTHNLQVTVNFKKKITKKTHKKTGWNRVPDNNNKPNRGKLGEEKKATLNSEILKNQSKIRDNNCLVVFSSSKPKELLVEEKGWVTDVGHNSWWHMKWAQHAAYNPEVEKMGLFRHPRWWP